MRVCLCLALMGLLSGCATVITRVGGDEGLTDIYPATTLDAGFWAVLCIPGSSHGPMSVDVDYSNPWQWLITPTVTACVVVDLVPSLVTDTLLVPYDLIKE
jgi:uncharacterized protein YceK